MYTEIVILLAAVESISKTFLYELTTNALNMLPLLSNYEKIPQEHNDATDPSEKEITKPCIRQW